MPASRYVGEFVVVDKTNGVQYLASKDWSWDIGNDLTGWILAGTVPTIASDGRIELFDNAAGIGSSQGYISLPNTTGEFLGMIHFKITRMVGDTSNYAYSLFCGLLADAAYSSGIIFRLVLLPVYGAWYNNGQIGVDVTLSGGLTSGVEYAVDIVITPSEVIYLVNNVRLGSTPRSAKGAITSLSATQNQAWRAGQKRVAFFAGHGAGQVSHYRVSDIKVGRLAGIGSV